MKPHSFELFVFDMDGVLVNSGAAHERAFADLWKRIGIQGLPYETIAGMKTRDAIRKALQDASPPEQELDQWIRFKQKKAREYLLHELILYEDTIPCLQALAGRNARMALGTAGSRETAELILKRFDLSCYFPVVLTAEDVQLGKPSPEIYLKVMSIAGVIPGQTLIIEDSMSGLLAGIASKAFVASVRNGLRLEEATFLGAFSNVIELLHEIGFAS